MSQIPTSLLLDDLLQDALSWTQGAITEHWLTPAALRELENVDTRRPAALFEAGSHRPLVTAFFGGTGVGKSTLLNRLAGQSIAKTGIVRPTSREVTVFLHEAIHISSLPQNFPLDKVHIARHSNEQARQLMWIDMPDIDSVEQHNRALVIDWVPHIDVLIYVVSPERYRDDQGWRLLRSHGGDHAWIFVINQWDRGDILQYQDFRSLLAEAGFADPIVLRTDCRPEGPGRQEPDFIQLQSVLTEVSNHHTMTQLTNRMESARFTVLCEALSHLLAELDKGPGYASLKPVWETLWAQTQSDLLAGLEWPMQSVATVYTRQEANPLARSLKIGSPADGETSPATPRLDAVFWDEWAEGRLRDGLDRLLVEAGNRGLPMVPLRHGLDRTSSECSRLVLTCSQLELRRALVNPGNGLQRASLKLCGLMAIFLPLGSMGWAAYQVVKGYYDSATLHLDYLGTDFAVHSLLLIGLSWLLPYFAYTRLKPSLEKAARKGLRVGIEQAFSAIDTQVIELLEASERERSALINAGRLLLERSRTLAQAQEESLPTGDVLRRMLPDDC
ncbi:MAG: GTPase [Methylococcaceae bacterium]|jgi:hypothetical protein